MTAAQSSTPENLDDTKTRRPENAKRSVTKARRNNDKKSKSEPPNDAGSVTARPENHSSELSDCHKQSSDLPHPEALLPESAESIADGVDSAELPAIPAVNADTDRPNNAEASESSSETEASLSPLTVPKIEGASPNAGSAIDGNVPNRGMILVDDTIRTDEAESNKSDDPESTEPTGDDQPRVVLTPEFIADFARANGVRCFRDQQGAFFVWVPVATEDGTHFECHPSRSKSFLALLLKLIRIRSQSTPKFSRVKQAIEILELDAYQSSMVNLENRRASQKGVSFIDLGDPEWNMIKVGPDHWDITSQETPMFYRPQHLRALPRPERGGDIDELFKFVPAENPQEKLLMTAWILAALHAGIPSPILVFTGQQGSAKTTRTRRIRSLLDPSVTPVLGDLEMSNLVLTFQHHAVPCFENVSQFDRRTTDMFCRAVTGNGVERRRLYTDSDQVLYSFRRPIIINGIDTPSMRPDFLDRCLIVDCRRMGKFQPLHELDREFEESRPRILGAMLDVLVKTLRVLPSTSTAEEFRMADFAHFGRAVAIALGQQPSAFDEAYRLNVRRRNFELLDDAPMVRLLKEFSGKYTAAEPWTGSAISLLHELRTVATNKEDANGMKDLPKSGRWLSSRLSEMTSALKTMGIIVEKLQRTHDQRGWKVFEEKPNVP
jgi:hypothetical protein